MKAVGSANAIISVTVACVACPLVEDWKLIDIPIFYLKLSALSELQEELTLFGVMKKRAPFGLAWSVFCDASGYLLKIGVYKWSN